MGKSGRYCAENQFSNYIVQGNNADNLINLMLSDVDKGYFVLFDANGLFRPHSLREIVPTPEIFETGAGFNERVIGLLISKKNVGVPSCVVKQICNVMDYGKKEVYKRFGKNGGVPRKVTSSLNFVKGFFEYFYKSKMDEKVPIDLFNILNKVDKEFGCQKSNGKDRFTDWYLSALAFLRSFDEHAGVVVYSNDGDINRLMFCTHLALTEGDLPLRFKASERLRDSKIYVRGMKDGNFTDVFDSQDKPKDIGAHLEKIGVKRANAEMRKLKPICERALESLDNLLIA